MRAGDITKSLRKPQTLQAMIMGMAFLVPFPQFYSIRFLVIILVASFFLGGRKGVFKRLFTHAWDVMFYLLVLLSGLLYSDELETGYRVIETSLSLLVMALLFSRFYEYLKDRLYSIFYAFGAGLLAVSLFSLIVAGRAYIATHDVSVFFFDKLTDVIDSHPTYLAYFLIAEITFGLYLLYYEPGRVKPGILIPVLFFLFLMLMLTGGLTAFVSMLLIFSFFALKFLLEEKNRMQTVTFGVVALMIVCMFALNNINVKEKNDYWERFVLWESALKATPDILWGVGTGDYRKVLNEYYLSHNLSAFASSNFNSHNQFIEVLFSNGLIGILSLIFLMLRPLYLSMRHQNLLGILTFFPFIIYGMTEVFLGRYQGVVFFALFHQCFITHYYQSHGPAFSLKDV